MICACGGVSTVVGSSAMNRSGSLANATDHHALAAGLMPVRAGGSADRESDLGEHPTMRHRTRAAGGEYVRISPICFR
jgi:hypothetical protein